MPIVVTDSAEGPGRVTVTNTDTDTSQTADKTADAIRDAYRAQDSK